MACQKCSSENQGTFNGEVSIRFPGLKGLDKSIVLVYSDLALCLKCGATEFAVPEKELRVLLHDSSVDDAIVVTERETGKVESAQPENPSTYDVA